MDENPVANGEFLTHHEVGGNHAGDATDAHRGSGCVVNIHDLGWYP